LSQNNVYYKVKAYANVLSQLYGYKYPIYTYENFKTYIKAGDKINAKVKELIETGTIRYEEVNIKKDKIYYFKDELKDVYGIGPAKANELISYGITTMEQLKANQHLLNDKQKLGLLYYKDFKKRIPLKEYLKHKKIIEQYLKKDFKIEELIYEFVGSFRRGSDTMGDIDILMMENKNFDLKKLIVKLHKSGYIIEILALGNNKFMGICKIGDNPARRIDILIAPKEEYYYSLLYFTGSAEFNVGFRNYVKNEFKLSLSEHGLKGLKSAPPIIKSEKDIFKYFKVPYLKPEERKIFINPRK
jgi:DNA polymerase beta